MKIHEVARTRLSKLVSLPFCSPALLFRSFNSRTIGCHPFLERMLLIPYPLQTFFFDFFAYKTSTQARAAFEARRSPYLPVPLATFTEILQKFTRPAVGPPPLRNDLSPSSAQHNRRPRRLFFQWEPRFAFSTHLVFPSTPVVFDGPRHATLHFRVRIRIVFRAGFYLPSDLFALTLPQNYRCALVRLCVPEYA